MSDKVAIFDTTLRDGEQAAGTRLGSREKLMIARQLAQLNVDVIEAGYPNSSPEDFEAVQLICQEIQGPTICALSRAVPDDIWHFHDSQAAQLVISQLAQPRRASKSPSSTRNRHVAAARCPASSQISASTRSSGTAAAVSSELNVMSSGQGSDSCLSNMSSN